MKNSVETSEANWSYFGLLQGSVCFTVAQWVGNTVILSGQLVSLRSEYLAYLKSSEMTPVSV